MNGWQHSSLCSSITMFSKSQPVTHPQHEAAAPGSRSSGYKCLIGTYHDKIHIAMEYTTIFRSHIVYSMGAYKALSIVVINYLCIMQIPRNLTGHPNLTSSLHDWFTATEPVSVSETLTVAHHHRRCQISIWANWEIIFMTIGWNHSPFRNITVFRRLQRRYSQTKNTRVRFSQRSQHWK